MKRSQLFSALLILLVLILGNPFHSIAQVNTATLSGVVTDPQGLAVKSATIAVTNNATGAQRSVVTDDAGHYVFVGLPPGSYKMTVDGGPGFKSLTNQDLVVTVGQDANYNPKLEIGGVQQTVTVSSQIATVETSKSEVSQTVDQRRIDNLPINGRNYINFALTNSQTTRDVSPTIGPAPNSGLNVSGARGRSNMVTVDGADAVDNSVNGIRATISQEGVQEFQLILSNYNAEYGRATGGVINIISKNGGNDFHGDAFGYFRNKSFQARNAFSGQVDPATGDLEPVKQAYTRVQTGMTIGGPIKRDKTFFFGSYEYTQREETGFSSIGIDNFGLQTVQIPVSPTTLVPVLLTPAQGAAVNALLAAGDFTDAANYGLLMGSASSVALNRLDPGLVAAGLTHGFLNPGPGAQFPLPVNCPAAQPVNNGATCSIAGIYVAPLPASYVGLNSIRGNYPVAEKTSLWSLRLDQNWNANNHSFLRVGVSPSLVTGLPSTSQNQVFGQNSGSRAGYNQSRDLNITFQHDTITSPSSINTLRFQYARRGLHFGFSQLPGGDQIGVNIPGVAYFGREPYSTVDRIERRLEFTDTLVKTFGRHTFKVGVDANIIQLRSAKAQIFELDFGGDVNFGGLAASTFGFPDTLPGATGLQAYGFGIPTTYIQGIGNSNQPFDNLPFGFFAQDSWRVNRKLTLNYGVRYDVEITPLFAAATSVNAAAEKALGVVEGIPRDYNNFAPRFGLAWDPRGDGRTVIRVGYGLFYDHPLLAVAFDSVTADGGRSVQLLSPGGTPSACGLLPAPAPATCGGGLDSPTNLNGSSIFQGVLNASSVAPIFAPLTLGYLPDQQRFDPLASNSLFANQNYLAAGFPLPILPFTLPVAANFKFGYAQQGNLTIERDLAPSWKLSVGYQYTRGIHLNRPVDVNSTNPVLLANNLLNADAAGLGFTNPVTVVAPSSDRAPSASTCGVHVLAPQVLGVLVGCPLAALNGRFVGTPAFFNFFRPSGPNPSFAAAAGGYGTQVALAQLAGYPAGFGVPVPFNSVDTQLSDASSWYHALTVNLQKRFSKGFELLSSYTWSHSIDDGTDLQSPLEPQDSRFPFLERANSVNDQRHRWVTSAVFQSAATNSGGGLWKHFTGGFTIAPIIEVSSGRPFNVITAQDTRLDLGASQARPSIVSSGGTTSPFISGVQFGVADECLANDGSAFSVPGISPPAGCNGNLGRNRFVGPGFFQFDLRLSKDIPFGERFKLQLIADSFNLFNRTNVAAVNQVCDPSAGSTCLAGQPTAAYDARQFQFALKLFW
ncbi:MAG TPA: TonB-dependent receptor [Verrucomicrobiae bacterium]|nr:TonB-dependent receptor [Verrucomicrobiae bacterium]